MRSISFADIMAAIGLAAIAAGLYFVYWPAALIVVGVILLVLGIVGSR